MTVMRILTTAGVGAGLAYLFSPTHGHVRRAQLRDNILRAANEAADTLDTSAKNFSERALGMGAEFLGLIPGAPANAAVLRARVHAAIARAVSHPAAISAQIDAGNVILRGPVFAHEVPALLARVAAVRGVKDVANQLEAHQLADDVPALRGAGDGFAHEWPQATRIAAGTVGGLAALYSVRHGGVLGIAAGLAGAALLVRAATNKDLAHLAGIVSESGNFCVQKTLKIDAPIEKVFALWENYENFPQFMRHVRGVKRLDAQRWQWTVAGPAGTDIEFASRVTGYEPNRRLAWQTDKDATVQHTGEVRFKPANDGGTTVSVYLQYQPPAGAAGDAIATLFGENPRQQMDDDLQRMKRFMETGRPWAEATTPA